MTKDEFVGYWQTRLQKDLNAFADPSTLVVATSAGAIDARWESRRREMTARFTISMDSGIRVSFQDRTLSYRAFLSCPDMADLLGLAKMRLRVGADRVFVDTKARKLDESSAAGESAVNLLRREVDKANDLGRTRIMMVTGDAGAGKTQVLTELVRRNADDYVTGKTDCLYLYINAQGRALARLYEAIATELQDLRALLTYHAIPALVHAGAVVPVIDGFDELLGVGGYDDAFSSLASFIGELDGEGSIIASARSAYYEQEFLQRAGSSASLRQYSWAQIPIQILNWTDIEFDDYARKYCQTKSLDAARTSALIASAKKLLATANSALLGKPLFITKTLDLLATVPDFSFTGNNLLKALVEGYMERERSTKLLDRNSKPLLTSAQMSSLMITLAEEMWNQETRELDSRSVKEIAEFQLEILGVEAAARSRTTERMPFLAFMTTGSRSNFVAFEHEMFFSYFLASGLSGRLQSRETGFELFLGRAILPGEVADTASKMLVAERRLPENSALQDLLGFVNTAASQRSSRSEQVKENAGTIILAIINELHADGWREVKNAVVRSVTFPGGALPGLKFEACNFQGVAFRRVDLTNVQFVNCSAAGLTFFEPTIDTKTTKLGFANFDPASVYGVRRRTDDGVEVIYNPTQILDLLAACGAVKVSSDSGTSLRRVNPQVVDMVQRLMRAYNRANPVCVEDWQISKLVADRDWSSLRRILLECGIVSSEERDASGSKKEFLRRRFMPEAIMAGVDRSRPIPDEIRRFWDKLEHEHPVSSRS